MAISGTDLAEIDPASPRDRLVFVPLADVRRIVVSQGHLAERPAVQLAFGGSMIAVSIGVAQWLARMRTIPAEGIVFAALVGFLGVLVLRSSLRNGFFLRVDTDRSSRKLVLRGAVDIRALTTLLEAVGTNRNIEVRWEAPDLRRLSAH